MNNDKSPGTYVRRRAYNKIHMKSWLIYLEKDGFVRCPFKHCNFMAFDVEEMRDHHGFCTGDAANLSGYICRYCNGRAVSFKKLQIHCCRAHNVYLEEVDEANYRVASACLSGGGDRDREMDPGKPSKVLQLAWQCTFEKDSCVRCSTCQYIANNPGEMARHYTVCKQEEANLVYICPECRGRTINVNPLLWHLQKAHKIFKSASQFNLITKTMIAYWKKELTESYHASCLHVFKGERDCSYFDLDLLGIIEHSQSCKGPKLQFNKEHCTHCSKWTNTSDKLNHHIAMMHSGGLDKDLLGLESSKSIDHSTSDNFNQRSSLSTGTGNISTERDSVEPEKKEVEDCEIVELHDLSTVQQATPCHKNTKESINKNESKEVQVNMEEVFIKEEYQIGKTGEKIEKCTTSKDLDVNSRFEYEIIVPSKENTTKFEILVPITKKTSTPVIERKQKQVYTTKDQSEPERVKGTHQSEMPVHLDQSNHTIKNKTLTHSFAIEDVTNKKKVTVIELNSSDEGNTEYLLKESKHDENILVGKENEARNIHSVVTMNTNIEGTKDLTFSQENETAGIIIKEVHTVDSEACFENAQDSVEVIEEQNIKVINLFSNDENTRRIEDSNFDKRLASVESEAHQDSGEDIDGQNIKVINLFYTEENKGHIEDSSLDERNVNVDKREERDINTSLIDKKKKRLALFRDDFSSDEETGPCDNDFRETDLNEVSSVQSGSINNLSNKLYENKIVKNYLRRPGFSPTNSTLPSKRLRTSDSFSDSNHHAEGVVGAWHF